MLTVYFQLCYVFLLVGYLLNEKEEPRVLDSVVGEVSRC